MHEFGGPSVLQFESLPDPMPRSDWVTVELAASALNWHDVLVRQGVYRSALPHTPGADGAGMRVDTGEKVVILPSLLWGNRNAAPGPDWEILGDHSSGTYAELTTVPAECLMPWPSGFNSAEAAALSLVGVTTYRALFVRGRLQAGENVLVLGASGGVATMAVALASAAGARVFVTSSSDSKIQTALMMGATDGTDHGAHDWVQRAKSMTPNGQGFDMVLDSVGRWSESIACLRPGGRCVVLGASAASQAQLAIRPYYFGQFELIGTTMGSPHDMRGLLNFMNEYRLAAPVIDRTFGIEDAAAAHERLESGVGFGKIVLLHR